MAAILGVNIDHVATLRQARGTTYPDPVQAALVCEQAGAEGITLHLREDRRHIQDDDVRRMRPLLKTRMNLELAVTDEMVAFAQEIQPQHVCFVPERRQEVTTEGGLDVVGNFDKVQAATQALSAIGCDVSLFKFKPCPALTTKPLLAAYSAPRTIRASSACCCASVAASAQAPV